MTDVNTRCELANWCLCERTGATVRHGCPHVAAQEQRELFGLLSIEENWKRSTAENMHALVFHRHYSSTALTLTIDSRVTHFTIITLPHSFTLPRKVIAQFSFLSLRSVDRSAWDMWNRVKQLQNHTWHLFFIKFWRGLGVWTSNTSGNYLNICWFVSTAGRMFCTHIVTYTWNIGDIFARWSLPFNTSKSKLNFGELRPANQ